MQQKNTEYLPLGQKLYFQCCTRIWIHFVAVLNAQMKNWKEKSSDAARATLYEAYRQIHFSEAQCAYIPGKD